MDEVLVTGGSGFVGSRVLVQLLAAGHRVRTTVRDIKREEEVRSMLRAGGVEAGDRLRFFAADLERDAGWAQAAAGCAYVLHVASPFPLSAPKHEDDLIVPARDGTLRVLRVAREAGVKRVVLTSSFAAIGYGHEQRAEPFHEDDWTDLRADLPPYIKSKTIAERAAWDFIAREGHGLELAAVNPVGILGPVLGPDYAASVAIVKRMMDGFPGCPRIYFGIVDVRDVADLHIRAMANPAAKGERFLAAAGETLSMLEVAEILRRRMGNAARKVPKRELPDWVLRIVALFDADARAALPQLGVIRHASNEKAKRVLGWSPRSNEEAIVRTAESLVRFGLV